MRSQRGPFLAVVAAVLFAGTPAAVAAPDPLAAFHGQRASWGKCAKNAAPEIECATIKVPLDYRNPTGKTLDVAISRIRADKPELRRGVIMMNPGGPGITGLYMPARYQGLWPRSVADSFDRVGFAPRGVEESSPLDCGLKPTQKRYMWAYHPETFSATVADMRDAAQRCKDKHGDVLPYITTANTARDMDVIRAVLGEQKISYVGHSYGTYLGPMYAKLFPQHVDRFVLNSSVNVTPTGGWQEVVRLWATASQSLFETWTKWAAERDAEFKLGATPAAVSTAFTNLLAAADKQPKLYQSLAWAADDIRYRMRTDVYWPDRASKLISALRTAAAAPQGTPRAIDVEPTGSSQNEMAVFNAITCADSTWPNDPETYRSAALRDLRRHPLVGDFASMIRPCAFWAAPREPDVDVRGNAPMLLLQNEFDSQTPLEGAREARRGLPNSRMVVLRGQIGHIANHTLPCVDKLFEEYLTKGTLPAKDVTC